MVSVLENSMRRGGGEGGVSSVARWVEGRGIPMAASTRFCTCRAAVAAECDCVCVWLLFLVDNWRGGGIVLSLLMMDERRRR